MTADRARTLVGLLLLAPILAAVLIAALLLFGVAPHLVFLPGHAVRFAMASRGGRVANAVGVLTTFVVWWGIVAAAWLGVRRLSTR